MALTGDQKKHLLIGGGVGALAVVVGYVLFGGHRAMAAGLPEPRHEEHREKHHRKHRQEGQGEERSGENGRGEYGSKKHKHRHGEHGHGG